MDYIRITEDNIDGEHICCAMSGKQSLVKRNGSGSGLRRDWSFTGAGSGASASSNISRRSTHGFPFRRRDTSTLTACGSPAP